jgi:hypothetical protein
MTDDEIFKPTFEILGPIPEPKAPEPPPQTYAQPSDHVLSLNVETGGRNYAKRPVYKNGELTGEWLVSWFNPKKPKARMWILKPNKEEALDWCDRAEMMLPKKI